MLAEEGGGTSHLTGVETPASTGSYILRPLVQNIPLTGDENKADASITCVELCDDNLYIGTSHAEILHFVSIPAYPAAESPAPSYIFASRLQPSYNAQAVPPQSLLGVQQILVLPRVQKACILCNGTLSFYSLPELSPAFGNTTVSSCTWVGGVDLNRADEVDGNGTVVMICVKNKVRLVRIRDEARRVRDIEFPGCLASTRRGNFACVADAHSYSLVDVENQQKISLFPISSLDDNATSGKIEDVSSTTDPTEPGSLSSTRSVSRDSVREGKGHDRSTSLGTFVSKLGKRQGSPQSRSRDRASLATPEPLAGDSSPSQSPTRNKLDSTAEDTATGPSANHKTLPPPPRMDSLRGVPTVLKQPGIALTPHICSPTPGEFLLTTGTGTEEAGVGIFVNLDGDVVRGTLEFGQYPRTVVVDGSGVNIVNPPAASSEDREGFVLAVIVRSGNTGIHSVVEIQRWDVEKGGNIELMSIPQSVSSVAESEHSVDPSAIACGLRTVNTAVTIPFPEIGELLRGKRLWMMGAIDMQNARQGTGTMKNLEGWETSRNEEEAEFGRRLGGKASRITLWSGSSVYWVVRNPLAMRLDAAINEMLNVSSKEFSLDRDGVIHLVNSIRGQEASTETEFLSLEYIRQKLSLILFANMLISVSTSGIGTADLTITEGMLMEGGLDPRVTLSLVPKLREEVIESPRGIWIHAGLISVVQHHWSLMEGSSDVLANSDILALVKRYLGAWRQRKGFGSIADEVEVFQTIDAALLRVLLVQDDKSTSTKVKPSSERAELYALVDSGVNCFDRAIAILEEHHWLFVLSRLYQSRRMARKVLETWKRIIEGERDDGGGFVDGQNEIRRYLVNIKDTALVDEYGTWLARQNPTLGVQVFTNDRSRVRWEPHQVVMLLRRKAPDAVKAYLEHLVFGKKSVQYANDLISYYLDSVLTVLGSSEEARAILAQSYESYRALHPPKPTYRQFIIENAVPLPWWHDRLRLLELIGGSHGSDFSYDVSKILSRIEPFEEDLVPESIILDGRQGRHKQALRLLTRGLGDYHTAVNYCLLGGASIFHPTSASTAPLAAPSQEEQAVLFGYLLIEFLHIEDVSDRLERTSELLERFSSWYNVSDVLNLVPETWSVELVSGFLISSFRRLVHEKNDAMITKALRGAENLQVASAFVEKCSALGPQIESIEPT